MEKPWVSNLFSYEPPLFISLNSNFKLKRLTVPEPTVDGNTRTYSIDLSQYKVISIEVFINDYGNADIRSLCIPLFEASYYIDYIDVHNFKWHALVSIGINGIKIKTLDDSTNPETNYLMLRYLSAL